MLHPMAPPVGSITDEKYGAHYVQEFQENTTLLFFLSVLSNYLLTRTTFIDY